MKVLLIVPFVLVALFYGLPTLLNGEAGKRKKVDSKDEELDKAIGKADRDSAVHEGEVSRLNKEKKEKLDDVKKEDPVSFHNKRKL